VGWTYGKKIVNGAGEEVIHRCLLATGFFARYGNLLAVWVSPKGKSLFVDVELEIDKIIAPVLDRHYDFVTRLNVR
jgi:hypothetical protein